MNKKITNITKRTIKILGYKIEPGKSIVLRPDEITETVQARIQGYTTTNSIKIFDVETTPKAVTEAIENIRARAVEQREETEEIVKVSEEIKEIVEENTAEEVVEEKKTTKKRTTKKKKTEEVIEENNTQEEVKEEQEEQIENKTTESEE